MSLSFEKWLSDKENWSALTSLYVVYDQIIKAGKLKRFALTLNDFVNLAYETSKFHYIDAERFVNVERVEELDFVRLVKDLRFNPLVESEEDWEMSTEDEFITHKFVDTISNFVLKLRFQNRLFFDRENAVGVWMNNFKSVLLEELSTE